MKDKLQKWNIIGLVIILIILSVLRFNSNHTAYNPFLDLGIVILVFTVMNYFFKKVLIKFEKIE